MNGFKQQGYGPRRPDRTRDGRAVVPRKKQVLPVVLVAVQSGRGAAP